LSVALPQLRPRFAPGGIQALGNSVLPCVLLSALRTHAEVAQRLPREAAAVLIRPHDDQPLLIPDNKPVWLLRFLGCERFRHFPPYCCPEVSFLSWRLLKGSACARRSAPEMAAISPEHTAWLRGFTGGLLKVTRPMLLVISVVTSGCVGCALRCFSFHGSLVLRGRRRDKGGHSPVQSHFTMLYRSSRGGESIQVRIERRAAKRDITKYYQPDDRELRPSLGSQL